MGRLRPSLCHLLLVRRQATGARERSSIVHTNFPAVGLNVGWATGGEAADQNGETRRGRTSPRDARPVRFRTWDKSDGLRRPGLLARASSMLRQRPTAVGQLFRRVFQTS